MGTAATAPALKTGREATCKQLICTAHDGDREHGTHGNYLVSVGASATSSKEAAKTKNPKNPCPPPAALLQLTATVRLPVPSRPSPIASHTAQCSAGPAASILASAPPWPLTASTSSTLHAPRSINPPACLSRHTTHVFRAVDPINSENALYRPCTQSLLHQPSQMLRPRPAAEA